jgi:hypothetical protein
MIKIYKEKKKLEIENKEQKIIKTYLNNQIENPGNENIIIEIQKMDGLTD